MVEREREEKISARASSSSLPLLVHQRRVQWLTFSYTEGRREERYTHTHTHTHSECCFYLRRKGRYNKKRNLSFVMCLHERGRKRRMKKKSGRERERRKERLRINFSTVSMCACVPMCRVNAPTNQLAECSISLSALLFLTERLLANHFFLFTSFSVSLLCGQTDAHGCRVGEREDRKVIRK